jgi:hypothetical protein
MVARPVDEWRVRVRSLPKLPLGVIAVVLVWLTLVPGRSAAQCTGDCDGNGRVLVNELVLGTNIALNRAPLAQCQRLDRDGNLRATVDELVDAVGAALRGCLATAVPTATPTPIPNQPPQALCRTVYRTFAGLPIGLSLPASDPGDALQFAVDAFPAGGQLNESTGLLSWTPTTDQLGPFYLPFTATDTATPPQAARGVVFFKVSPLDPCTVPNCNPATGCAADVVSLANDCCSGPSTVRVSEPFIPCPEGRVVFIGANLLDGFGRLQNCDRLRFDVSGGQGAPTLRFRIGARCLNTDAQVRITAELSTRTRGRVFNRTGAVTLTPQLERGFAEGVVIFPLTVIGFDLEDQEANLHIRLSDSEDATVSGAFRVVLTSALLDDQPDIDATGPTPPMVDCSDDE